MATKKSYKSRGKNDRSSPSSSLVELSKALSWLLRHAAVKEGFELQEDGYVFVEDVLKHRTFSSKYTVDDIHQCVENDNKKRFGLKIDEVTGKEMIRAHQGHSMEDAKINMREITDPKEFPVVLHGSYLRHWPSIQQHGLSRMSRTHIHFAPGLPKEFGVISGMRSNAQLHIYIDIGKAMRDGYKFFVSDNNVILSPGNENGFLPSCYFRTVEDHRGQTLLQHVDSTNDPSTNAK